MGGHEPISAVLAALGIDPAKVDPQISSTVARIASLAYELRRVIIIPGGPANPPDADCMERELPSGREPTEEEIQRAIERCRP